MIGGRPMYLLEYCFTDVVSGERVCKWLDRKGRIWLAVNRWGWFRVKAKVI
jgi:hypothetical protein